VDTSTEVEATDGYVTGVFNERLALNSAWHNPSGMPTQQKPHRCREHASVMLLR
jgi:hypothetical protein